MAVRKIISSKEVIAKTIKRFNLIKSDWIPYAGEMINTAMRLMQIRLQLEYNAIQLEVANYRVELPCDFYTLIAVEYNGYKINETTKINYKRSFYDDANIDVTTANINIDNDGVQYKIANNYLHLIGKKEATIILHYNIIPKEFDEELNVYFPCIPDVEQLKEALSWYIFKELLLSGEFKHTEINWQIAEQKWNILYPQAQNACKNMTFDERMNTAKLLNDIIPNTNINNTDNFYLS